MLIGGLISVTIVVAIIMYLVLRPMTMIQHARTIAYASLNCDADTLFEYMDPGDTAITGITRNSFRDGCKLLIEPRLRPFRNVEREETELLGLGDEGACTLHLTGPNGIQFEVSATPFLADEGRGAYEIPDFFGRLLKHSWLADYAFERKGKPVTELGKWKVFLRELEHDAPTLRTLGIKGFISHRVVGNSIQDLKLITWDEYRSRLVKAIAKLEGVTPEQKPTPAPPPTPPPASAG